MYAQRVIIYLEGKERKEFEMAKETHIHLRIDQETKEKAARSAEQEGRTISNYIIRLIEKDWRMKNEKWYETEINWCIWTFFWNL